MASCFQGGDQVLKPLRWYRELSSGKGRRRHGYFILEGRRAVMQAVQTHPDAVEELLIEVSYVLPQECDKFTVRKLRETQLRSIASSVNPQGIIAVLRIPPDTYSMNIPSFTGKRIVLLEDVQDPGNVGTMIRNAAAFGFSGVILSGQCADPFGPKAVQSSAGAVLVPWIRRGEGYIDAVAALKKGGFRLYGADIRGRDSVDFSDCAHLILAFGNEGAGLSESLLKLVDFCFSIPMNRYAVESLNVAAAGAISLFAAFKKTGW